MTAPDLSTVDPNQLPPQIRQLVNLIGLAETFVLLDARGGTTLRIPKVKEKAEVLPGIISMEAVERLCKAIPGKIIELPMPDKILLQIRNQIIREQRQYKSASQLAREYNRSRRQIINISKAPVDDGQMDLFKE